MFALAQVDSRFVVRGAGLSKPSLRSFRTRKMGYSTAENSRISQIGFEKNISECILLLKMLNYFRKFSIKIIFERLIPKSPYALELNRADMRLG